MFMPAGEDLAHPHQHLPDPVWTGPNVEQLGSREMTPRSTATMASEAEEATEGVAATIP
jgi:hypothetical protein